ncbi:MAG TPA: cytochrome c peroxidase [bacterium]|nr:cytochrome c peroxidase [bacterium]
MKRLIMASVLLAGAIFLGGLLARGEGQFLQNGMLPSVPVLPDNPQTDPKIRLGKQLYFDTRLSADNTVSCATCHIPETGWAHRAPTDTGIKGQVGGRNSGSIIDAAYMKFQFWDGRAGSLEEQALGPIANPIEMGETLDNVVRKLNAIPGYREQFQAVFGTDVTTEGIGKAIASFERTIISGPSPYDKYLAGDKTALSAGAERGMKLFNGKAHCTPCHSGPTFSDQSFHNLGVGMDKPDPDIGREKVTNDPKDRGRFKTPGLRNVAETPPYLHDGSEATLMDVIELYNKGGARNPNLDPLVLPLNLTRQEKEDLVAFMESLTGPVPKVEPPVLP